MQMIPFSLAIVFLFSLISILLNFEDVSGVHDLASYYPHDADRGRLQVVRDTESLDASYERYLRNAVLIIIFMLLNDQLSFLVCYGPIWHVEII